MTLIRFITSFEAKVALYTLSLSEKHASEIKTNVVDVRRETAPHT